MKRVLFVGIVLLLVSSLGGIACAAEQVFWDRDRSPDATITDKDFKYKYGSDRVKSFGDQEIYDTEKNLPGQKIPPRVYVPAAEESAPFEPTPAVRPEIQRRQQERVRTPEQPTRKLDITPSPAEITPKEPARPRLQQLEKSKSTSTPSAEATKNPPLKKMKWGKDAEPTEEKSDDKPKFQWGK